MSAKRLIFAISDTVSIWNQLGATVSVAAKTNATLDVVLHEVRYRVHVAQIPDTTMTNTEPLPPVHISIGESEYNGRMFYGNGMGCNGHAEMRSELIYLRDWKAWAQREADDLGFDLRRIQL